MIVRRADISDHDTWATMLARLHDGSPPEFKTELAQLTALPEPYVGFLAFSGSGEPIGMIDARLRNYAEGAPNIRAAYVEDLWVEPQHRRARVAQRLLEAVEQWARDEGMDWLGSDTELGNEPSRMWHLASGFEEVERLTVFGKPLA